MSQAARLQQSQRFFNLVVTNVPGPQLPLYLLGRRLRALYPVVPIAGRQALGIAVMSYDGRLGFGLLADYDALRRPRRARRRAARAIDALAAGASIPRRAARGRGARPPRRPLRPRARADGCGGSPLALGAVVLAVLGVVAAIARSSIARDDATVPRPRSRARRAARAAGARPAVARRQRRAAATATSA